MFVARRCEIYDPQRNRRVVRRKRRCVRVRHMNLQRERLRTGCNRSNLYCGEGTRGQSRPVLRKPYPELIRFKDAIGLIAQQHKKAIQFGRCQQMEDRHASEAFITTESGLRPYGLGTFGHMGHRGRRRRLGHGACHFLSGRVRCPHLHRVALHAVTGHTKAAGE